MDSIFAVESSQRGYSECVNYCCIKAQEIHAILSMCLKSINPKLEIFNIHNSRYSFRIKFGDNSEKKFNHICISVPPKYRNMINGQKELYQITLFMNDKILYCFDSDSDFDADDEVHDVDYNIIRAYKSYGEIFFSSIIEVIEEIERLDKYYNS
jgi:hypothetical protein